MITPIGQRPISLAAHLRRTAHLIRTGGISYDWKNQETCNCGILVRSITGMSNGALKNELLPHKISYERNGTWTEVVASVCPLNPEMPAPQFFKRLFDAGLRPEDFGHLEHLSHPELRASGLIASLFKPNHKKGPNVADYCDRWAAKIEAYHAGSPVTEAQMEAAETRPLVGTSTL